MSVKRNILIVTVILLICLIVLAFTALNIGRTVTNSDGYVSTVRINDVEPDNWSRLGLQLHYAVDDEIFAEQFLESTAQLLQDKGIGSVAILPPLIDLQATGEDLDGVLIFHFDFKSSGWQFSRQGKVFVAAEFVPLKKGSLVTMNIGSTTSAAGRGWINRTHFNRELIGASAEYWVQETLRGFDLVENQSATERDISCLESNIDDIPPALSGLIAGEGNLQAYVRHGDNYVLSYLTATRDLESMLESELTDRHNMKVVVPWVDATGSRRLIELISEDGSQEIRIYYSDTTKIPYTGGFDNPISSDNMQEEFLVTIISLNREQT